MDLNSVGFSVLAVSVLYFVTVRTKEEGLLLETMGDNGRFCYQTFRTLVKALDNTVLYLMQMVRIIR